MSEDGVDASRFGKYELLHKVGSGGMAELYLARLTGIEGFRKLLVIKRILPRLVESHDAAMFTSMFLDEARLAARLDHPGIVQIHELGEIDGQYYITMEYVDGVDLARLLQQSARQKLPVPVPVAVRLMSQVCEALHYAHTFRDEAGQPLGVVHRDVSPHNVLVAFNGSVKLTDFGIAKAVSQATVTKVGSLKGKLNYFSPEQITDRAADRLSDVFSVGVLLYQLLTYRLPFRRASEHDTMRAIVYEPPAPPRAYRADLPADLEAIVLQTLAKRPAARPQTAQELQTQLDTFLVEHKLLCNAGTVASYLRQLFPGLDAVATSRQGGEVDEVAQVLTRLAFTVDAGAREDGAAPDASEPPSTPTRSVAHRPSIVPSSLRRWQLSALVVVLGIALALTTGLLVQWLRAEEVGLRRGDAPESTPAGAGEVYGIELASGVRPDSAAVAPDAAGSSPDAAGSSPDVAVKPDTVSAVTDVARVKPASRAARRSRHRRPAAGRQRAPSTEVTPPTGATAPPTELRQGFLNINTTPWSEVWIGARRLGTTPLAYLKLPVGRHQLRLRNPERGLEKTIWVEIEPGLTRGVNVKLDAP